VYSPSREWDMGSNVHYFNWPQRPVRTENIIFSEWKLRKNKSVMVAANKISTHKGEIYSLRRAVLGHAKSRILIDLAGKGWNESLIRIFIEVLKITFKNGFMKFSPSSLRDLNPKIVGYLGVINDKNMLLKEYKVSIVIENSIDYVSEKLFDALDAGNIVIYVGGELANFGLSSDIAIQVSPELEVVIEKIESVLNLDENTQFNIVESQQRRYLAEQIKWNNKIVLDKLACSINKSISD
jgi:hypothetical protein